MHRTATRLAAALVASLGLIAIAGCAATTPKGTPSAVHDGPEFDTLTDWMTGSFSSAEQAGEDPDNFFPVVLEMVPIWTDRADGPWLYVEQAIESARDRPYRQRVYRLANPSPGVFTSDVYELPDPGAFINMHTRPAAFDILAPEDLDLREGCTITLIYDGDRFTGATTGTGCASNLRGSSYATSEVDILPDRLLTWDRGFDDAGEQVWGATAGGYVFVRVD